MAEQLFKRLEKFRKRHGLSILALCRELGTRNVNYYRWKEKEIRGPYKKIIEEFLEKNDPSKVKSFHQISSDIAVVGMACYYPGAHNVKELWENILARRVQFRRILDQRLPLKDYYNEDPKFPDTSYLTKAAFIDGFEFNWSKLRIPKKTFESTDIVHWLALDTALRAFEDAGYQFEDLPLYQFHKIPAQNTGVILGNTLTGEQTRSLTLRLRWPYVQKTLHAALGSFGISDEEKVRVAEAMEKIYKSAFYPITEDSLSGGLANTIAGRICNYLNLKGGGYIVDGACSSSLLAVATAANALKLGEMDLVLAGGVDVSLDPFELVGFSKAGALAKDQMRVYDQRANGFVPGEGCGFVLLKRLEDAVRDKDYIYAVVKGWGISSDGKGGMMEPSSGGQATAIQRAYRLAGYTLADVDFIEGHGTGTTKGDRVELEGMAAALKAAPKKMNGRICGVTSFKSIVGHTKAAAGIGGFIKAVLAVNQRILPPTANCQQPNEVFEKDAKQLYPLVHGKIYPADKIVHAGVSSAGFGGINCHITIQSKDNPHKKIKPSIDERALLVSNQNSEVFVFASRTIILLRKLIQKFKEELRNISMAEMADLSARLNKKVKANAPVKIAIVTDSPEHLYEALCAVEKELESGSLQEGQLLEVKSSDPITYVLLGNRVKDNRVGFLYPGQGAQRLNMTRTFVERFAWARDLLNITKIPIGEYVYKPEDQFLTKEENEEFRKKLSRTEITQPAITFSSLVWTEFLSKLGVEPEAVGGHSLGELLAFYKGGAFGKKTLLRFAELRGKLMAAGSKSAGMVSLFCDCSQAEELVSNVKGNIVISNINSPNQTVVSGGKKELEKVIELAKAENISTYLLPVSNAFHSSFMETASKKVQSAKILEGTFRPEKIGIYSCINGERVEEKVNLKEYFAKQILMPVNFIKLVESISEKCDLFIEVGSGRILTDLVKAINKGKGPQCFPLEGTPQNDRDLNVALAQLFIRNIKINWQELYRNRAIKPFVPASRRKFIENQCERPLKGVEQKELLFSKLVKPAIGGAEATQKESPVPSQLTPSIGSTDDIAKVLIDLTHKVTGFDTQSINLNLRLLDDLNLDSIKAAELIAEAAKTLGLSGQIDPSQFSNNTLAQIRDRFVELKSQAPQAVGGADNVLVRYQRNSWVRNFIVKFEEEKIKQPDATVFKRLNKIDILSDNSQRDIAYSLKQILKDKRIEARIKSYDELDKTKTDAVGFICILPANHKKEPFGEIALKRIIDRLYHVMTAATHDGSERERAVVFVQFGGGSFGENGEATNIESCCARSFASTLHLERLDLRIRVVDFDKNIPADVIAKTAVEELQTPILFSIAGYDKKLTRRVPVFHNTQPVSYKKRNIQLSSKDVVLVTGGAKGITAECAFEFARKTKAQMILVGRSELPPQIENQDNEIKRTLNRFKEEKLKCQYYSCDVTNLESVQQLIGKVEKDYGKITAVIHGAGLNTLKRLKQTSPESAYQEALPKVMGAINICKVLEKNPPKLFVGITSVIGVTGMEGSGWYGLANEILNLFLHQFRAAHKETEVVTVAYSVWDEIGMGTKLGSLDWLSQKGISPIPVAEGVKRFMQLVEGDPGNQQTIVVARIAGIDTWKSPQAEFRNGLRFIENVKYCMPGVELIAQAQLNVKDDSYVLDHNWKGSLLYPMVFGLEAMAQAACYITSTKKIQSLKFRNINLERPIPVNQQVGTTIEIYAQTLELNDRDASQKIKVEIHSEQTNFKQSHFSAIIELDKQKYSSRSDKTLSNKSKNIIDLHPELDLYGPILFQGKMFQCIEKIHELFYDTKAGRGECLFTSGYNRSAGDFLKNSQKFGGCFLIGDPFLIDSLLQSMQLIATQDACLPNFIEEIDIGDLNKIRPNGELIVKAILAKISEQFLNGNAQAFYSNDAVIQIKNSQLKIIEHLSGNPLANDLVNPEQRDNKIFNTFISKILGIENLILPKIYFTFWRNFKDKNREQRKLIIKQWLEKLGYRNRNEINLAYSKNNRPVIRSPHDGISQISISHKGNYLVLSLGETSQGVDIEDIQKRSINEWHSILHTTGRSILNQLLSVGTDLNVAGTCAWSIVEALYKAVNRDEDEINYEGSHNGIYIFSSKLLGRDRRIISGLIELTRGVPKICAFIVNFQSMTEKKVGVQEQISSDSLKSLGFTIEDLCGVNAEYTGPQGQLVFKCHFPVTFKNNQLFSKNVYFTNYFDFCGTLREYSIFPIMKDFLNTAKNGKTSMITKMTSLDVYKPVQIGDIIEGRLWMESLKGQKNSTMNMFYEWYVINRGPIYKVADCRQDTIWIKLDHTGKAEIDEYPPYLKKFVNLMEPRISQGKLSDHKSNKSFNVYSGKELGILGPHLPNKYKVNQKFLTATLENSNLLSNIYFSNYAKWIGQLSDEYFYQCLPDFYSDYSGRKEIFCSNCSIDYTNECFPFDRILIEMFIDRVFEKGIEVYFEFHKVKDDKKVQKLAYAKQQILFVSILDREFSTLSTPTKLIKLIKELRT